MEPVTKIASLKTPDQFRRHVQGLGIEIPIDDPGISADRNPLKSPVAWNGRSIGNRIAIQPMEGWDGTTTGGASPAMTRRWQRFGESGAKLIWGGEAMAVRPDGRANPNQLILLDRNAEDIRGLLATLRTAHRQAWGNDDDLVVGFQLTHSGRFCRPNDHHRWEPHVAHRHPLLDAKFGVTRDEDVLSSAEIESLIEEYVRAAKLAASIGADFVDIKSCHGYLLHEFLSARSRTDAYGGSLQNRARVLLTIIARIREALPEMGIGVRLSAFDMVPFEPDPSTAEDGKLGRGRPREHAQLLPYVWGFGLHPQSPLEIDLEEPLRLIGMLRDAGVRLLNVSAGSPYYTPHLVRPAAFPPSDGYQPHEDPLRVVAKHIAVTRAIKQAYPEMLVVGSGYTYLQEYLSLAGQHNVRAGWTDFVGLGRMVLSYPTILMDAIEHGTSQRKRVCRTFSDCTTAPRNGLPSGCYPLDEYYKGTPNAELVKQIKARFGES